jgi:DNA helicase-2/ATP-dependent DNA helicase PcrA
MDILEGLNPQQMQAVTAPPGAILVLAGPGSGKTRVLTHRIAYLIGALGVRPYSILAMTFTNKAAREMQTRVERLLGGETQGLWLGTFHASCARILRREAEFLPVESNFVIFDADDQETLVKRAVRDLNLNEKLYRPVSVHASISKAKNELIGPDDFPTTTYREEVVKRIYQRYQALLTASNAVDFDDLLLYASKIFSENPLLCQKYARRFEHVLVDEFQDTNEVQYTLLRQLASYYNNLFVVGDEDQSIYRWRGADYRNVLRFEQDYPKAVKVLLEQNYRSSQNVLDAARAVIDHNTNRTPKHLFSERGKGEKIVVYEAVDDHAEAAYVVDTIVQEITSRRGQGGDFAIMYRTNAQSRLLEEAFLRAGLPYRLVGAQRFYGRREVKDAICYLRLVYNPDDEVSLGRVINVPPRGVGDKTLVALQLRARQSNLGAGQVLLDLAKGPASAHWQAFTGRGAAVLADFAGLLSTWRGLKEQLPLPALFDRILDDVGYHQFIDDASEEGQDRWGNVLELRRIAVEYEDRGLVDFLENIALVSDQDTLPESVNVPTLLTLHAAKGLEFRYVFIIGMDEGLLPHSRSRDDPEEMAEERRLFYVGITRAKDRVYLVRAERRSTYGPYEEAIASSFLADVPEQLVTGRRSSGRRRERTYSWQDESRASHPDVGGRASHPDFGGRRSDYGSYQVPPPPGRTVAPSRQPQYAPNMRIRHAVWGEGWVLESRIEDDDETVDVAFDSVGFKRLAASLAHLEIVPPEK